MSDELTDKKKKESITTQKIRAEITEETNINSKSTTNEFLVRKVTEDNFNTVSTESAVISVENNSTFNSLVSTHNVYISIPILIVLLLVCFLSIFFTLKTYRKRKKSHRNASIVIKSSVECYYI